MTVHSAGHSHSKRELFCHAGAGAAAGAVAATFVCPLDVIKTRLQVHGIPPDHKGSIIITSLQNIVKKEGLKGMYRGLSPTILALLPNWAVYFTVYERLKDALHSDDDRDSQLSSGAHVIAAAAAGASTAVITNPLWVVKTRLQTQGMRTDVIPYKGVLPALSRITYEEGLRGLYSGILPSLVGVSHVAIQFPAYEKIKFYMAKKEHTNTENLSPIGVAISSSIAKVIASIITYPHEVIRSRLQEQGQAKRSATQYLGVMDCIKKVFLKEGIPGFYRGCATNLLRTTPSAVITFTSYETIHRFLLRVVPPDEKNSQSHDVIKSSGDGSNSEASQNSESQSSYADSTHIVPGKKKEQFSARG